MSFYWWNTCGLYHYDVKHQDSFSFCYVCSYALTFFITYHLCKYLELVYEEVNEWIKEKHLNVALMIKNVDIGKKKLRSKKTKIIIFTWVNYIIFSTCTTLHSWVCSLLRMITSVFSLFAFSLKYYRIAFKLNKIEKQQQ